MFFRKSDVLKCGGGFSVLKSRFSLLAVGLILVGCFAVTGCLFNNFDSGTSAVGSALQAPTPTARVRFNFQMTENVNGNYRPKFSRRANGQTATVRFRLLNIVVGAQAGQAASPAVILERDVPVQPDDSADAGELEVPATPCIGQAQVQGADAAGFTDLHGGMDLQAGENVMNVSPAGTGMPEDRRAGAMEAVLACPEEVRQAVNNNDLAAAALRAAEQVDRQSPSQQVDTLNNLIAALDPETFVHLQISPEGKTLKGLDAPQIDLPGMPAPTQFWSVENTAFWAVPQGQPPAVYLPSTDYLMFTKVLRHGLDGSGYVACQHDILYPFAVARLNTQNGARTAYVRNPGLCLATLVMPDNSVVAGGMNNDTLSPVIFRWNGTQDAHTKNAQTGDNDSTDGSLMWVKYFTNQQGVEVGKQLLLRDGTPLHLPVTRAEPTAGVVAVQWDGAVTPTSPLGNLLISVRDAQARRYRIFRLKPDTGDLVDGFSPPPPASAPVVVKGTLKGDVRNAENGNPLAGVLVTVWREDGSRVSGPAPAIIGDKNTDTDGTYELTLPVLLDAGQTYTLQFSAAGYEPATMSALVVTENQTTILDAVRLTPSDYGTGNVGGEIKHAVTGAVVPNLSVRIFAGMNNIAGDPVHEATTDGEGKYRFDGLVRGQYTAQIYGPGYATMTIAITALKDQTKLDYNGTICPTVPTGKVRIVLTWGEHPRDLDSHMFGPRELPDGNFNRYHIAYFSKVARAADNTTVIANLDVDDVNSYGPETVTIEQLGTGTYRYMVHDYTNRSTASSTAMARSEAKVRVLSEDGEIAVYNVPSDLRGNVWNVFELRRVDLGDGNYTLAIRPFNQLYDGRPTDDPLPTDTSRASVLNADSAAEDLQTLLNNLPEK